MLERRLASVAFWDLDKVKIGEKEIKYKNSVTYISCFLSESKKEYIRFLKETGFDSIVDISEIENKKMYDLFLESNCEITKLTFQNTIFDKKDAYNAILKEKSKYAKEIEAREKKVNQTRALITVLKGEKEKLIEQEEEIVAKMYCDEMIKDICKYSETSGEKKERSKIELKCFLDFVVEQNHLLYNDKEKDFREINFNKKMFDTLRKELIPFRPELGYDFDNLDQIMTLGKPNEINYGKAEKLIEKIVEIY